MIEEVYGHLRPICRQEQMNMVQIVGTVQIVGKVSKEEPQAVGGVTAPFPEFPNLPGTTVVHVQHDTQPLVSPPL